MCLYVSPALTRRLRKRRKPFTAYKVVRVNGSVSSKVYCNFRWKSGVNRAKGKHDPDSREGNGGMIHCYLSARKAQTIVASEPSYLKSRVLPVQVDPRDIVAAGPGSGWGSGRHVGARKVRVLAADWAALTQ